MCKLFSCLSPLPFQWAVIASISPPPLTSLPFPLSVRLYPRSDLIEGRTTESGPLQREPSSSPSHFSEVSLLVKLDIVQKRRHGSNLRQDTGIPASEETVAMVSLRWVTGWPTSLMPEQISFAVKVFAFPTYSKDREMPWQRTGNFIKSFFNLSGPPIRDRISISLKLCGRRCA